MSDCTRCGKCCFYPAGKDRPGEWKRCKHLINDKNGKFLCRIYGSRLGKQIDTIDGVAIVCVMYNSLEKEITGCPLNKEKKELIQVTIAKDRRTAQAASSM